MKTNAYPNLSVGKYLLFIMLGIILSGPCAWSADFTADITQHVLNNPLSGQFYASGHRYRMDLHSPGSEQSGSLIVIVDRRKGKTLIIPPGARTCEEVDNFSLRAFMVDPFQTMAHLEKTAQKKKIGTDTVAGRACDHYGFYDQDFKLADAWFTPDLGSFPVKAHIKSGREEGHIKIKTHVSDTRIELSHIKTGSVAATLFALPQGIVRAEPGSKAKGPLITITDSQKGVSPWGRRIGPGGEIRVKTDPRRPVTITLKNLADESVCTYTAVPQGKSPDQARPVQVTLNKKGRQRKVEIGKNKKTEWVLVRVDKGAVFGKVINEKDSFASDSAPKLREDYLVAKDFQGFAVDPARTLTIAVTGDSQDGKASEVILNCYRDNYKDKAFGEIVQVANGQTRQWEFATDRQIRTCEISVGKTGGIRYTMEQPAQ